MFLLAVLLAIVIALALVYLNGKYNESYWKKRGVKYYPRNKTMGPLWDFLTTNRSLFEIIHDIYKKYPDEPAVGIGATLMPGLYVKDLTNIQHVLQSDFQSFNHRGVEVTEVDLLADNILFMIGNRWKLVRQHMTPLFTGAKLKNMYYIIDKSAIDFVEYLKNDPENLKGNIFETLSTFCSAAVSAAVFGISTKSIFDSPFLTMAREAFKPTTSSNLRFAIVGVSSWLSKLFKVTLFKEHQEFFIGAIKQVIRQREKENVKKHDFADICVSLQKQGPMRDAETGLELEPSDELLAAQAFFFFVAGVEPTATALFGTLIELGRNPKILEKVQQEIDETYTKYNGKMTYDTVNEMEYLDKVLSEALRMHPPIGFLTRKCTRDTVLPVGNIRVQKGTNILTPIYEMHYDPKLYPNPKVFDPERFSQDAKGGDFTYQPFGKGGRICIGMRYARLQVKAGLIHLLREFNPKTVVDGEMKYSKQQVQVRLENVDVKLTPRKLKNL